VLGKGKAGAAGAVAAALASRHPRHIKRFLYDLALTLAVLRNAGKLGPGAEQVPEGAVLAWHLVSELLPPAEWREVRALTVNARTYLRQEEELGREKGAETGEGVATGGRLGALQLTALTGLTDSQLHLLVHLASPAAAEVRGQAVGRVDLLDLDSGAWVHLPGGTFAMGSENGGKDALPVHRVTLSPFSISRFPVTNAEYASYVQETGKRPPVHWEDGKIPAGLESHPVVNVAWSDAEAFCTWLTRRLQAKKSEGAAQLPTEAQWELAARGESGREYPWGDEPPDKRRANFGKQVGGTTPVDAYPAGATPEGMRDLAGNVREWCRDWFGPYPEEEQRDPLGPDRGVSRVLRGGSFVGDPGALRSAFRNRLPPDDRSGRLGFRVVWGSATGLD
jgi:formylglycine-generating enzyme required for sulfatase activity